MTERIIVTGGRDFADRELVYATLDAVRARFGEIILSHGDGRGCDQLCDDWARSRGVMTERYPADWDRYGRSAGPRRSAEMIRAGGALLVAFPGGRGTRGAISMAERAGIPVQRVGDR